ncbi:MAG TPA: type II toxin-antitoxin system VapB family antitoxin, partial [Actinomycetota bacterium]|jgi:Arc/MetJ family transcription regulator|nr:type II toxin-antitoxin system VapB family antitoxin [Actinomycetota bacterium]
MKRTNVVVDEELVERVKRIYRVRSTREAIDLALRRLVGDGDPRSVLELEGVGWPGDLDEIRHREPPPDW